MAWITGWNYQKQLYINGTSAGIQPSYQMKIIVNFGTGTDSAGNIYCGNNVNTDFSDIRFTDTNGTTLLNYWIESYTASSSATVWIQIPSIPTGSNSTYIYFYYNNPSATTSSNGQTTFLVFSDISNLASWTGVPVTNLNGEIYITGSNTDVSTKPVNVSGNWIFEMKYWEEYSSQPYFNMYIGNGSGGTIGNLRNIYAYRPKSGLNSGSPVLYDDGGTLYSTFAQRTYYILKEVRKGTNLYDHFLLDSNRNQLGNLLNTSFASGGSADPITAVQFTPGQNNNLVLHVVWLLIRKYSSPEPTWGTIATGSLSISSAPPGAEIYLNGIDQNTTTTSLGTTISNLSPDTYNILLRLTGYADWYGVVTISSGTTTSISVTLYLTQWLTNWNRRKQLYISSTNSITQSSYQMMTTVHYGSGTDIAGNIYCGGNVKSDFSDIRFTDSTGSTLLNYWIQSYTASSSAIIWVQIPSIPTGSNSTYIYFYYNNPSATTTSNGANTFLFYDDFNDGTTIGWNNINGGMSNPSTYLQITCHNGYRAIYSNYVLPNSYRYLVTMRWSDRSCINFVGFGTNTDSNTTGYVFDINNSTSGCTQTPNQINLVKNGALGSTVATSPLLNTGYTNNTFYNFIISSYYSGSSVRIRIYESGQATAAIDYTDSSPILNGRLGFRGDDSLNSVISWDNTIVANYASPEPTWSPTISTEQLSVTLNISSNPTGAEIWLRTPAGSGSYIYQEILTTSILYVAPGTYDLKLTLGGYQDYILSNQTFSTGYTYNIQATLIPIPGSLSILSTPTGAEIYLALQPGTPIDKGTITSPSGTTISSLTPGTYNIKLTLVGYQDWSGTATVSSNSMTTLVATFAGSVYITSTPSGAEIYLAISPGTPTDQNIITPGIITNLTAASSGETTLWNYKLTLSGYTDMIDSFTAIAGSTIDILVTFPGSLYITSIPTGASVYIDGVLQI